jgi:5-methylcytosine-specific restriction protein A
MPWAPRHPCATAGCAALVESGRSRCAQHERQRQQVDRHTRGSAAARDYDVEWQRVRAAYARQHPLCEPCLREGRRVPLQIVDHRVPITRGGARLDPLNLESQCRSHHARKTWRERQGG